MIDEHQLPQDQEPPVESESDEPPPPSWPEGTILVMVDGQTRPATEAELAEIAEQQPASAGNPVPSFITARQFLIQLAVSGIITEAEALAAARLGEVPAAIDAIFAALPEQQALGARITWARMTTVPRSDPLFVVAGPALSLSQADIDDFFRAAAAIS